MIAGRYVVSKRPRTVTDFMSSILVPIGLFFYGWTARASVHWIAPIIGRFVQLQHLLLHLAHDYGSVALSLVAA